MAKAVPVKTRAAARFGNTVATGAILFVLTGILGQLSGAYFNPVFSLVMALRHRGCATSTAFAYSAAISARAFCNTFAAFIPAFIPALNAAQVAGGHRGPAIRGWFFRPAAPA